MKHDYDPACICLECHKYWVSDATNNKQEELFEFKENDSDF